MPRYKKQRRHLRRLNNILPASKEKPVARIQTLSDSESSTASNRPSVYCELDQLLLLDQDIECHAEEEEEEAVALEDTGFCGEQDDAETDKYLDSFKTMQISAQKRGAFDRHFSFARGPQYSERHARRLRQKQRELKESAANTRPITTWFTTATLPSTPSAPPDLSDPSAPDIELLRKQVDDLRQEEAERRENLAICDLKKRLENKKTRLDGQDYRRHQAVLMFLNHLEICWKEKQYSQAMSVSLSVAKCFQAEESTHRRLLRF
jgi:hypothetical protein